MTVSITTASKLFAPRRIGAIDLKHRIVMAPMTRLRATKEGVPSDLQVEMYTQRATDGGLLITEGTLVAGEEYGLPNAPGIWNETQVEEWKKVVTGVHSKGGKIICQIAALGRMVHPDAVETVWAPGSQAYPATQKKFKTMEVKDIERFVGHFKQAASNAVAAGFDGVELHAGYGYIQSGSNDRTDQYGGTLPENRFRFPLQVLNAVSEVIGADRVGIRISPFSRYQGMREGQEASDPLSVFVPFVKAVVAAQPSLAYVHGVEFQPEGDAVVAEGLISKVEETLDPIREVVAKSGVGFIASGGYTPESANAHAEKQDDLIAFGRHYIPNPDLVKRIENNWPLTEYDQSTFYIPESAKGYTDFPIYTPV
ncbi:hypothetical protein CI109_105402 [Kwoniella shandongensis]|uniref:Uncharacterized protein n=1 Tax=Kwoniella shandongensis TaxID=1734106 RepID=A0A5M6BQK2_9TREE|nr:uncharacterized protein CI109_007292 [Kwoniella shandongensis]KAA5524381.1 hypothetical protein CI109_007292 [Kwoniella shandongensis]